jgi:hypothetical protein
MTGLAEVHLRWKKRCVEVIPIVMKRFFVTSAEVLLRQYLICPPDVSALPVWAHGPNEVEYVGKA